MVLGDERFPDMLSLALLKRDDFSHRSKNSDIEYDRSFPAPLHIHMLGISPV